VKIGVLVSGSGSNLQAILDADLGPGRVVLVISNKPGVRALERAEKAGVPTRVLSHKDFPSREAFDEAMVAILREAKVELVALAGFMRIVTKVVLDAFPQRVVNVHPALLPAFPGVHAQRQALDYGVKWTGCTVHFVDEGTDTGPIISQSPVPVYEADSEYTLGQRILAAEHTIYPAVLRAIAERRVVVDGRVVRVLDSKS